MIFSGLTRTEIWGNRSRAQSVEISLKNVVRRFNKPVWTVFLSRRVTKCLYWQCFQAVNGYNLGSLLFDERELDNNRVTREGWNSGVEQLRRFLITWWAHHTTPHKRGRDNIIPLQELVNRVFPGTQFIGVMPRDNFGSESGEDSYFLLDRNGRVYDLAEMSSGEQAVFPLAYEFVRLDIKRSIVLIDELELHLHPPEQQRLLAALPKIGPDCQFLITTHSEFLTSAIPNEQEVRLNRGTRCL